jgi:polyhydroxyalkanoate synthase
VLGFCVGGTLLSTALAVLAARGESPAASLTLLTTLLDFSDNGVLDAYIDEKHVVQRESTVGNGGIMLGKELSNAFATLRPNDLVWNYVVSNYLKGEQPSAFDLLYWNSDSTNLPGPMFCWYLRNTYLENRLKTPGAAVVCGVPIDLKKVNVPTYVLACRDDHIVPWHAAYRSQATLAGDKRLVLAASGHIAGVVNSAKKNKRNYWTNDAAALDKLNADAWLDGAQEQLGSWWNDWSAWLKPHAGAQVAAPNKLGTAKFKPIEAAPGRYVKVRVA